MKLIYQMIVCIALASPLMIWTSPSYGEEAKQDCSCPRVRCGPCQKKVSLGKIVKFCDWGDINVCRKYICENVNFYFGCLSKYNKQRTQKKKTQKTGEIDFLYDEGHDPYEERQRKRRLASQKKSKKKPEDEIQTQGRILAENESRIVDVATPSDQVIGSVLKGNKKLKLYHRGRTLVLSGKRELYVDDEILNQSPVTQKMELQFENGRVAFELMPKSKLSIQDPQSILGRFQPFLYLIHGGVRFAPELKEGFFDLLAGQILIRSQGGDHGAVYEMARDGLQVKVESFAKDLKVIKAQNLLGDGVVVSAGRFVSWMSETPGHLFSLDEKKALAGEGFVTPVFQMTESRRKQLGLVAEVPKESFKKWKRPQPKGRDLASTLNGGLCQAPKGKFDQCAWSCEGNSKGAKHCQAEKENVRCIRRLCNAAGEWGAPTAFASSYKDLCPPQGVRVGECQP